MIDFSFYHRMRPILKDGIFRATDYFPEELTMLFTSLPIIQSEYCGEEFRRGALEYLEAHRAEYLIAKGLALRDVKPLPSTTFLPSLIAKHDTFESLLSGVETKEEYDRYGRKTLILRDNPIPSSSWGKPMGYWNQSIDEIREIYEKSRELYLDIYKLSDYYAKWIGTIPFNEEFGLSYINKCLFKIITSIEQADVLFSQLEGQGINTLVYNNSFCDFPKGQLPFWQSLIAFKGWPAIRLAERAYQKDEEFKKFLTSLTSADSASPLVITESNADAVFEQISKFATSRDFSGIAFPAQEDVKYDIELLKSTATKYYYFPSADLQRIIDDILIKITGVDYLTSKIGAAVRSLELSEVALIADKEGLKAELLPKTDPMMIFEDHKYARSKEETEFFKNYYSDPYAGIMIIKDSDGYIIAYCYVNATKNSEGEFDGIIIDSLGFSYTKDILKSFSTFIHELSKSLTSLGLKLYLRDAEKSTKLSIKNDDGSIIPIEAIDFPNTITEDYEPYKGDTGIIVNGYIIKDRLSFNNERQVLAHKKAYIINPDIEYVATFPSVRYYVNVDAVIFDYVRNLPEALLVKIEALPELQEYLYTKIESTQKEIFENFFALLTESNIDKLLIYKNLSSLPTAGWIHTNFMEYIDAIPSDKVASYVKLNKYMNKICENSDGSYCSDRHSPENAQTKKHSEFLAFISELSPELIDIISKCEIGLDYRFNLEKFKKLAYFWQKIPTDKVENLLPLSQLIYDIACNDNNYFTDLSKKFTELTIENINQIKLWLDFTKPIEKHFQTYTTWYDLENIIKICTENVAGKINILKTWIPCIEQLGSDFQSRLSLHDLENILKICEGHSEEIISKLAKLPQILRFTHLPIENLIRLSNELSDEQKAKLAFIDNLASLYFSPEKIEQYKLILDSCTKKQIKIINGQNIFHKEVATKEALDKYLAYFASTDADKCAAILSGEYDSFLCAKDNVKTICRLSLRDGYSPKQIIQFLQESFGWSLQYNRAETIETYNLHKIIPIVTAIENLTDEQRNALNNVIQKNMDLSGLTNANLMVFEAEHNADVGAEAGSATEVKLLAENFDAHE